MAGETDPWALYNRRPLSSMTALSPNSAAPASALDGSPAVPGAEPAAPDPWAIYNRQPLPGAAPPAAPASEPGVLSRIGSAVSSAAGTVKDLVVGKNEFEHPEIGASGALANNPELWSRLNRARDDKAMLDVLRAEKPDVQSSVDKHGNIMVEWEGKPYYLNRSGLSARDATEGVRDTLLTAPFAGPAANLARAAALPIRAAAQAVAGAAGSLASDVVSRGAGSEQNVDLGALVAAALGGAGGEALGTLGGALISKIRNSPARYVSPNGQLTGEGEKLFAEVGLDPKDVTEAIAKEFEKRAAKTGAGPATAKEVAAAEFGVPLTRGQAAGDFDQIAFENAAKAGARGEVAGDIVRDQFGRQAQAIDVAKGRIGDELGPKVPGLNQYDAADVVRGGVRARSEAHSEMVDAAWEQAREMGKGVYVPKGSIRDLPQVARDALRQDPRYYTPDDSTLYPVTLEVKKLFDKWGALDIGEITTKSGTGVTPTGVALELMDEFRKMLSGKGGLLSEAQGGDKLRVGAMVKAFNSWLDGVADEALMSGAGPQAVQQFKNARAASAKHFSLFAENNTLGKTSDKAGQVLERMIGEDVTSAEVANWMWGKGRMGEGGDAYRLAKRLGAIFPKDGEEWQALRRGMWDRLTTEAEGKNQPGAQALSQNILEFVNGKGRALAGELFDAAELSKMRRFAATLKNTLPPPDATNPSKSGYELARVIGGASTATSSLPIRLFLRFSDSTRNIGPAARALSTGGGAPVVRTPSPAVVPAVSSAASGDLYRNRDQDQ